VTSHLQRQLVVAPGASPVAHDLDQKVIGHILTLEEVTPAELLLLNHVLVELEGLRADPLLGLDGNDVVAADYFLAVSEAVVHADLDGGRGGVEEADEEDAGATAVRKDAAVEVQAAVVLVDYLDGDLLLGVGGDDAVEAGRGCLLLGAEVEDSGGGGCDGADGGDGLAVELG